MFTIAAIGIAVTLYTVGVWYVGRNWNSLNSVPDVEAAYQNAVAQAAALKAKVQDEITATEARAAQLKTLV